MNISKETGQAVAKEMDAAMRDILAKHGLQVGKVSTGHGEWFEFKVTAVAVSLGDNGVNLSSKEATYYSKFGYTAYDEDFTATQLTAPLGTLFYNGNYAFAGIDSKKKKNTIVAIRIADGKTVLFPDGVVALINDSAKQAGK